MERDTKTKADPPEAKQCPLCGAEDTDPIFFSDIMPCCGLDIYNEICRRPNSNTVSKPSLSTEEDR
jgi:hypothetical protein